jgi:ATP-dependent RNA helicase DDX24/MAK5
LPILNRLIDSYQLEKANADILDKSDNENGSLNINENKHPQALILTPTRELAIQVKDHLQVCCKYQTIKIAVVVGGISQIKQERLLKKSPEIIVATPGRLMQMIDEGNEYLNKINLIKYLVIDEADRMIEKGSFCEMEKILNLVNSHEKSKNSRQNFLFSATLIINSNNEATTQSSQQVIDQERQKKLSKLVDFIQMTRKPHVIDLTTRSLTATNLTESKIHCPLNEKDYYLYYFVCKYDGRTLVFANSIDCVRRLTTLFRFLKKNPYQLHANMNQKARLVNLEKFNRNFVIVLPFEYKLKSQFLFQQIKEKRIQY